MTDRSTLAVHYDSCPLGNMKTYLETHDTVLLWHRDRSGLLFVARVEHQFNVWRAFVGFGDNPEQIAECGRPIDETLARFLFTQLIPRYTWRN